MSTFRDRITIDPTICHGKPTVRGLRYPVEMILDLLSSGMSHGEILGDYPDLEREDILAVLEYAARLSRVKTMEPLTAWNSLSMRSSRVALYCGCATTATTHFHTLDLPDANRTPDAEIISLALSEGRIVVTKDADFVESFILQHRPEKLLLISTGNISNTELETLLLPHLQAISDAFATADFIEVTRFGVMVHSWA
jgi:uncharacterized protein (DUF433 family)/predicted nuclease of predicted toxin-antitoxin system